MNALELKIPPVIVLLIFAVMMWCAEPFFSSINLALTIKIISAVIVSTLGISVILLGGIAFKKAQTTVNPMEPESSSTLVNSGIYQYTRNPMYVGFTCILLGWNVFLASPLLIIFVAIFACYIQRFQIIPEERILTKLFDQAYIEYCQKVRRWL